MRPNLINRLKEEWNNLDPVDPLRGLIADAIDALAEQPAQDQGQSCYCPNCEALSKELAALKAQQQPKFSARDDAERLKSVGRGMSYNDASEAVWKHTLMEIAMRLETGGYASPQPKPWAGLTDEEITAGAQALCQQMAEACNVDPGDQWSLYADTFKEDAKAVLTAAAKLLEKNA